MGILITDHNVRETLATTDRAYILNDGAVLAAGRSEEVAADPQAVITSGRDSTVILDRLKRATWMRLDLLDRWLLKELLTASVLHRPVHPAAAYGWRDV